MSALAILVTVAGSAGFGPGFGSGLPAAAAATSPASPAGGEPVWVTLLTGDRILLDLSGEQERVVTIDAGEGRDGLAFRRHTEQGELHVMPADAAPLVAAGRVDRRLFNVSALVEFGYDDRGRTDLPLIVTYGSGSSAGSVRSRLATAGGEVVTGLSSVDGEAVEVAKSDAGAVWEALTGAQPQTLSTGIAQIWLDGQVTASLEQSVPQVGAPVAWDAGHTGTGAVVAVLDSGIDTDHPDLAGAVVAESDFTQSESGTDDLFGHGTHVAGTITGDGAASGGRYVGVAPGAQLLNGKVLNDFGSGSESGIIAGMQWAVERGADVVNMSLGESGFPSDGTDPMSQAVNTLTREHGTLFVVSAGNDGPTSMSISSPGVADEALTVGAVDKQDALAEFSSRGPRWGDLALKPDITAPGVGIVAPLAEGSLLGEALPVVDGQYLTLEGTSMAAPHVAGAAAILAGQHPEWDAGELKPALVSTARPHPALTVYEQGAGRLDAARAVTQQVFALTPHVDNGIVRWPHEDDQPITRTVTYRNDGTTAVTLDLAVAVRDPRGDPAPSGMFTVDRNQVTVPAGGAAAATLVTDTSVPAPDGTYGGLLTASTPDGQTVVRTPVGVTREVESYDVTLTFLDRAGQPTPDYFFRFVAIDTPEAIVAYDASGTVVARVPAGRHYFEAQVVPDVAGADISLLVEPELSIAGDLELVVDARQARPIGVTVDEPAARPAEAGVGFGRPTASGPVGSSYTRPDFDGFFVAPSATVAPGEFTFTVGGNLAEPDGAGGFDGSPYLYHVHWSEDGRVPAELVRRIRDSELATVQTRIAASAPGQIAAKDSLVDLPTPATITERYMPDVEYFPSVSLRAADAEDPRDRDSYVATHEPVTYQRGETVVERWNLGVFGPSFPSWGGIAREGNVLAFVLQQFGDQAPGRYGGSRTDSFSVTLSRDGIPLGEWSEEFGSLAVPAEPGVYRLAATATRSVSPLSTQVSAVWTFRSAETGESQLVPAMVVRFAPNLDDRNRARAGIPFTIPIRVEQQTNSGVGPLRSLTVQVSYDDGRSWRSVPVLGTGPERTAMLVHPRGDGFVSLRAIAVDRQGTTVEQTIIHAYALKR